MTIAAEATPSTIDAALPWGEAPDAGIWTDIPQRLLNLVGEAPARLGGDGRLHVGGVCKAWAHLARMPLPAALARPGPCMLRAVVHVREGGAGLYLMDASHASAPRQVLVHGAGVHVLELDTELAQASAQIVIRYPGAEEGMADFDVLLLQWALRPPGPAPARQDTPAPITLTDEEHHPAIRAVPPWRGDVAAGFLGNWVGTRIRQSFSERLAPMLPGFYAPHPPAANDEYFQWTDMLEAIDAAQGSFTMVELGAGFGRWVVDAWGAIRRKGLEAMPLLLVAVEAEPQHFQWLQEHFRNNGLDPARHRLIEAAVTGAPGSVTFCAGHAGAWYGQAIVPPDHGGQSEYPQAQVIEVRAVTLDQVLDGIAHVDLLDMDIQGAELDVCTASMSTMLAKVRRAHISTHGEEIEAALRQVFRAHGWRNLHDYPLNRTSQTAYGPISFGDGVQTWINPRLG